MLPLTRSRNRARFFGTPFSPEALFAGGTVAGAWYDPSDLTTLFTTSAGTTQCAMPGQGSAVSVGLMLDKSQGLQRFWSGYFDGTGDYLSTAASAGIAFGTGDFTIECWVNTQTVSNATQKGIFQTSDTVGGLKASYTSGVTAGFGGTGNGGLTISVGGTNYSTAANLVTISAWFHLAVTRAAGVVNVWLNGVSVASGSGNTNNLTGQYAAIGGYYSTTFLMTGNVSNFRIIKGTAIYTGAFTPPSPVTGLTAISGTSLLTCQNSTFIDNSGNGVAITANGDAVTSQNIPLGNHAIAFNDTTARPELRARVNLLTYSEDQSNGVWSSYNATQQSNVGIAPDGTNTADRIVEVAGSNLQARYQTLAGGLNISHTVSAYAKADQRNVFNLSYSGVGGTNWFAATFELTGNGSVTKTGTGAAGTYTSSSITPVGNGWYFCTVTGNPGQASTHYAYGGPSDTNNPTYGNYGVLTYSGNTANGVLVWGFDVRPANIGANVPAYQRIADANTYDTSGFPLYLRFDGIDDSMYTPANLNLSGTDKVAVFAGVRRLANATDEAVTEFSPAWNGYSGAFIFANVASGSQYSFDVRGTSNGFNSVGTYAPPITSVRTGLADIGASTSVQRVNGVQVSAPSVTFGTGNFGTYPLFIGARNNSSIWFNGHLYSLAVVGSAVSGGNIAAMESWVAGKTGIAI